MHTNQLPARRPTLTHALRRSLSLLWASTFGVSGGAGDWVPTTDLALQSFANNFAATFTADPTIYGLTSGDASAFQALADAYSDAYDVSADPTTRTPTTIAAKDAAKNAMKPELRRIGNLIQANPSVSDADKLALGLTIRDTIPTPISAPTSFPLISILAATPYNHSVKVNDSDAPTTNAKPASAIALELHVQVSATPLADPEAITYAGLQTQHLFNKEFSSDDVGKTAYYVGRWITRTGLVGPWSDIASMTVAA